MVPARRLPVTVTLHLPMVTDKIAYLFGSVASVSLKSALGVSRPHQVYSPILSQQTAGSKTFAVYTHKSPGEPERTASQ